MSTESLSLPTITFSLHRNEEKLFTPDICKTNFVKEIPNAHGGSVLNLLRIDSDTIASGSKDGSIKYWNANGALKKVVYSPRHYEKNNWVTALANVNDKTWISGTRWGQIELWNKDGTYLQPLKGKPQEYLTILQNEKFPYRVNCVKTVPSEPDTIIYYVGWPSQFSIQHEKIGDIAYKKINQYGFTQRKDWVYCIEPISGEKILIASGSDLKVWQYDNTYDCWNKEDAFSSSCHSDNHYAHNYIGALKPLDQSLCKYVIGSFDGSVKILDLASQKIVMNQAQHTNKVRAIENIRDSIFASGSDDGKICIWDSRIDIDPVKISNFQNRVKSLLQMNDNLLIAGTSSHNFKKDTHTGGIVIWDIRV